MYVQRIPVCTCNAWWWLPRYIYTYMCVYIQCIPLYICKDNDDCFYYLITIRIDQKICMLRTLKNYWRREKRLFHCYSCALCIGFLVFVSNWWWHTRMEVFVVFPKYWLAYFWARQGNSKTLTQKEAGSLLHVCLINRSLHLRFYLAVYDHMCDAKRSIPT